MKPFFLTIASLTAVAALSLVSCSKDLNRNPPNSITASQVFSTPAGAKEALGKVYGAYGLTGSQGSGTTDLGGIDPGPRISSASFGTRPSSARMRPSAPGMTPVFPTFTT
jgi:hypothetical protein